MQVTVEIDPARRTAAFREVSYLAAGDSCRVVLDGVRGADFGSLALLLYRDAASESPVASCSPFAPVRGHPSLADGELALDTAEMAAWFADAVPEESDDSDDALPRASASAEPRLAARASLAERSVRADGWLVVLDRDRTWAACRVPVLLRPGAGGSGAVDPTSIRALVEGLVSAALSGKADRAVPSAAGNLASLDASGNLADSGATPASIKAAAVAEVVANAPGTMDTLKEIADILGSTQQTGTVLKRILDLESGKADSSSLAAVATSGSYNDLSDKPAIPAVDATLATQGAAADAKAVGDALRGGFTEWEFSGNVSPGVTYTVDITEYEGPVYVASLIGSDGTAETTGVGSLDALTILFGITGITATRHAFPPTKTSQLTNDGDGTNAFVKTNDSRLSDARTPTAHHATHAANGSDPIAPADIGAASASDLPYRLVEPGRWEYEPSVQLTNFEVTSSPVYNGSDADPWSVTYYSEETGNETLQAPDGADALSLDFGTFTATRASLPGHLLDRAVNAVSVTGATTLTLPSLVTGKSRDLLVRLTVSADAAVTFSAPSGETVTWDDAGSPTATYEAGTHLLRFTEVAQGVFHFTDLGDGGSIDPAVLNGKLEATSAAPAFDSTKTYPVGWHVTYGGVLYECTTAVTTAGAWTGSTNWKATDMTSPDATLDLMADGRLRLVSADGEVLWMQGYGLASASSVTLSCDKVNFHAFTAATAFDAAASYSAGDVVAYDGVVYVFTAAHSAGAWTGSDASVYAVALAMPTAPGGKVGDFVLDVDNTANASASVTATLTGAGTAFDVFTPEGVNLSTDILTFAGGEQCELYFTMTAFGTAAKPAWKVVKQIVEKQEFGS